MCQPESSYTGGCRRHAVQATDSQIELVLKAATFAFIRHAGQTRKGVLREPYVVHPLEVSSLVAKATDGADVELIAAAILHDTVEDTPTTLDEISARFNDRVRDLVAEVTDDKALSKFEQKRVQVATLPMKSNGAKLIRLADKISNLRSLANDPPRHWSAEQAAAYIVFCGQIGEAARDVSPWLEAELDHAVEQANARLQRGTVCHEEI